MGIVKVSVLDKQKIVDNLQLFSMRDFFYSRPLAIERWSTHFFHHQSGRQLKRVKPTQCHSFDDTTPTMSITSTITHFRQDRRVGVQLSCPISSRAHLPIVVTLHLLHARASCNMWLRKKNVAHVSSAIALDACNIGQVTPFRRIYEQYR